MDFEREWDVNAAADNQQQALHPEAGALRGHANMAHGKGVHAKPTHAHAHAGVIHTVVPNAEGVVVLPAGTNINDIEVAGRDLIVTLPDGTQMLIQNGAVFVPHIVIGDVEIPTVNLAALLIGQEPQPAAGPARSSGGNFLAPDGNVGDPHGLGDLLPPTELNFTQPEQREILPVPLKENTTPDVVIVTPDQPAGAIDATAGVSEAGLGPREGEPAGSDASSDSEFTSGRIVFSAQDGVAAITINGQAINLNGSGQQFVDTPLGRLTITSIEDGAINYTYTLRDNVIGPPPAEVFTVVVTDTDGDKATATLTVSIADDVPHALNDVDSLAAGSYGPETGNVVTGAGTVSGSAGADVPGADGINPAQNGGVVGLSAGANGSAAVAPGTIGTEIDGQYGKLTIFANGDYSYTRNPGTPGGVSDSFTYTLRDGDGDLSAATLRIDILNSPVAIISVPRTGEGTVVDESGLGTAGRPGESPGSDQAADSEQTSGTITYSAPDGPATITINGVVVAIGTSIPTDHGVLLITDVRDGAIDYTYTLTDNTIGDTKDNFTITVTDVDGDKATDTLTITIVDDVPHALPDTDAVAAGSFAPEGGNVISGLGTTSGLAGADTQGADGARVSFGGSIVNGALVQGSGQGVAPGGSSVIHGQYGDLTLFANGDYSYSRTPGTPGGVEDKFVYVLLDGDGDTSPATLTISIGNSTPSVITPVAGGETTTVYEAGLPARGEESEGSGEQAAPGVNGDPREAVSGTVTFHSGDGIQSLTVGGVALDPALFPQTVVNNGTGTLVITGGVYDEVTGDGSFTYTYTLKDNTSGDHTGVNFDVVLTDEDGQAATSTLAIAIVDDVPHALPDTDAVAAGSFAPEGGNVITGLGTTSGLAGADTQGADGARVSFGGSIVNGALVQGSGQGVAPGGSSVIHGQYGDLTLFANGDYSYSRTPGTPGGVEDKFVYVLLDGDGDTSPATLTISIGNSTPSVITPVAGGETTTVYEAGLPARGEESEGSGEQAAPGVNGDPREAVSGTVTFHSGDGIQSLTVGGVALDPALFPQTVVNNGTGTLVITGGVYDEVTGDGSLTYTYTLKDNTSGDHTGVNFDVVLTDEDGQAATSTLAITIVDDVPHALPDTDAVAAGSFAPEGGNVITGLGTTSGLAGADTQGADGARVSFGGSIVNGALVQGSGQGVAPGGSSVIHGQYGDLTLFANGDYSYSRTPGTPGGVEDKFVYVLLDGDGDTSPATLTISIGNSTPSVITPVAGGETTTVYEAGLPARGEESEGSGEQAAPGVNGDPREAVSGTVTFHSGDGIQSLTVGGVALDPALFPQTVVNNGTGTLVITGGVYDEVTGDGSFTYTYTLKDNTSGDHTGVNFDVVLTDEDGQAATSTLAITIVDDVPHALPDTDAVAAGSFAPEGGNVITGLGTTSGLAGADTQGADGARVSFGGSIVNGALVQGSGQGVAPGGSSVIHGQYGDLTLFANGDYSYSRTPGTPGGVEDKFVYVLLDGDGDTSPATLTISIGNSTPSVITPVAGGEMTTVYEAGLPARGEESEGSGEQAAPGVNGDPREAVSGTVTFHSGDGIQSLTVDGVALDPALFPQTVVNNGTGTLVITGGVYDEVTGDGSFTYTYTLKDNTSGDHTGVNFDVVLTDEDGQAATSTLAITIVDDVPHAVDDSGGAVTEDAATNTLSGNVLVNDVPGADWPPSFVAWGSGDAAAIAALNSYGTLTQNSDGSWSYVLDNSRAATQALAGGFSQDYVLHYTMQDADGDQSSATLTITVKGADDSASVVTAAATGPDNTVYEAGLPSGSLHDGSNATSGSFTVSATDGVKEIVVGGTTFSLAQMQAFATTNGVVDTGEGTLRLTGYTAATGVVSYSYTLKATIDNDSYAGATPTGFDDSVTLSVHGVGGSSGSDNLVVRIVDDVPTFGQVQNQQTDNIVGSPYVATGTLHFMPGADGFGSVTGISSTTTATSGGHSLVYAPLSAGVLTAYQDANNNGTYDAGTDTVKVFTLTADPTAVPAGAPATDHAGTYSFQLLTPLDPQITNTSIGGSSGFGAGPTGEQQLNGSSSSQHLAIIDGWSSSASTLANAFNQSTWTQQAVNSSVAGFGVNNNNLDSGEIFITDFHNQNAPGISLPPGQSNPFGPQIAFATFTFPGFGSGDKIYYQAHYEDGTSGAITQVDSSKFSTGFTVAAPAGEYLDYIVFYDQSGNGKFNLTNTGTVSSTVNQLINFTISASDGDGDIATTSTFQVNVLNGGVPSNPVAPVVLDLNGDGLHFAPLSAGITFDYKGDGHPLSTSWAGVGDGVLALQAGNGYQVAFGVNGLTDLQGLAANFDTNHDGVLTAQDADWAHFGALVTQTDGTKIFETLTELGIKSIDLTANNISYSAANGDVTVLGEATFTRTDGSKGIAGDAVFLTAPKDSTTASTDATTSGFNQALVAASLVAVAGAVETVTQEHATPAPVEPSVPTDMTSVSTPTTDGEQAQQDQPATLTQAPDQGSQTDGKPVDHGSSDAAEQSALDHASLHEAGDAHDAPVATADLPQPDLGDHQGLLAQSVNVPAFDGGAAVLAAAATAAGAQGASVGAVATAVQAQVAEVVQEALGNHHAVSIDALLAALPGGANAPASFHPVGADVMDSGHMAAISAGAGVLDAAMAMHAAMVAAHA